MVDKDISATQLTADDLSEVPAESEGASNPTSSDSEDRWPRRAALTALGGWTATLAIGLSRKSLWIDSHNPPVPITIPRSSVPLQEATPVAVDTVAPTFTDTDDGLTMARADLPSEPKGGGTPTPRSKAHVPVPNSSLFFAGDSLPSDKVALTEVRSTKRPQIAIVLDDLGLSADLTRTAIKLPGPLTLAFLPYGRNLESYAVEARANRHEVIVHMPMEPSDGRNPGPNALLSSLSSSELLKRLDWNLSQFDGFVGVNNHMGSVFTQEREPMQRVLAALKERGLYFLDSRTTTESSAPRLAMDMGIPLAERDVFLDNHRDAHYLAVQLAQVERVARRYGTAIAIGHPHPETVSQLKQWIGSSLDRGFDLVPVSAIIARRRTPLWRLARDKFSANAVA